MPTIDHTPPRTARQALRDVKYRLGWSFWMATDNVVAVRTPWGDVHTEVLGGDASPADAIATALQIVLQVERESVIVDFRYKGRIVGR